MLKISRHKSFQWTVFRGDVVHRPQSYSNPNSISPVSFSPNKASSGTDALSRERRRFMFANSTFIQHSFSRKRRWFMLTNSTFIHQHSHLNETFSGTDWRPAFSREEGRHNLREKCNLMSNTNTHKNYPLISSALWFIAPRSSPDFQIHSTKMWTTKEIRYFILWPARMWMTSLNQNQNTSNP